MGNQGEIILYQPDEEIKLDVRLEMKRYGFLLMKCLICLAEILVSLENISGISSKREN